MHLLLTESGCWYNSANTVDLLVLSFGENEVVQNRAATPPSRHVRILLHTLLRDPYDESNAMDSLRN